jgi:uncharacterized membrane protein YdbT with pleckstrin-like domain
MNYEKIWNKTLSPDEKVEYEFSIGNRYRKFFLIIWGIISLPFLFAYDYRFGILIFLIALFYYGFYLKVANAYAFTNKRVLIHRGWLSTNTTSIDYSKITDVYIQEPFFDRLITHTGHIAINTAGTTLYEVILKHIESPYEVKKKLDALKDK